MTTEQARRQVDAAEQEIERKHAYLCSLADDIESRTKTAASGASSRKTLIPLLVLGIIGVILLLTDNVLWGIVVIAAGIYVAKEQYKKAKKTESSVTTQRDIFKSSIDRNRSK